MTRTAFVTGAAQGIGQGISTALGAQGYRVAVVDRNLEAAQATAEAVVAAGGTAIAMRADVSPGPTASRSPRSTAGRWAAGRSRRRRARSSSHARHCTRSVT